MKKHIWILSTLLFFFSCKSEPVETTPTAIRGVWVPAPQFTEVLHSYSNVKKFVQLLENLHMNAIYLVSYAGTSTIYKSQVLTDYSTCGSQEDCYMLQPYMANYSSATNDPVRDLIDQAHQAGIKVFFWFEYGFMGEGKPIPAHNPLLAKNTDWLGIGNDGKPSHYNNSDYYFNAYNPSVRNYLLKLVEEAIMLYPDIDGIQGDDRMPAMPRNSGYDKYTVELYKEQHDGKLPPSDYNNPEWVRWRLNILNEFANTLYTRVKKINPEIMVSFAPNPYPWCEEKLMQEWPEWCKNGRCDLLAVQCYRYTAEAYRSTVKEVLSHAKKSNPQQLFAPGMILMEGGNTKMTPGLLQEQLQINRQLGITGEIFFYNKGLENPGIQQVLRKMYTTKVSFPTIK